MGRAMWPGLRSVRMDIMTTTRMPVRLTDSTDLIFSRTGYSSAPVPGITAVGVVAGMVAQDIGAAAGTFAEAMPTAVAVIAGAMLAATPVVDFTVETRSTV